METSCDLEDSVQSVSYIGRPRSKTAVYITKKVEHLLINLVGVENCLVFCESTIEVPQELLSSHRFIMTNTPQLEYAKFVEEIAKANETRTRTRKYKLTQEGYYIGENVHIGNNAWIEPSCLIGHDVIIGDNCRVLSGVRIKNAIIGDNFIANENSVIGSYGFTMTNDEHENKIRIPTLGKVIIGDDVEVGALVNVSCGSGGDTTISDNTKIDALCHIAHDDSLQKNVELPAGTIIGGFTTIGENAFIGINSSIRNRVTIGESAIIGMGSVVTKNVPKGTIVVGNPAKVFTKRE